MRQKILEIIQNNPKHYTRMIKNDKELYNWVIENSLVSNENTLAEQIRSALYNESNFCEYGKKKKFKNIHEGFGFCGRAKTCECCRKSVSENVIKSHSSKTDEEISEIVEKRKNTIIDKYGVDNIGKLEKAKENHKKFYENSELVKETVEKYKKTNIEKYGVENPQQNKEIQEKTKQTNIEKYGVENPQQNKEIQEKTRKTNLEKYGVDNVSLNPDIKNKISNKLSSQEVREKTKKTNLERYGVEYASSSPEVRERIKNTNLEKYGVENPTMNPDISSKISKTLNSLEVRERIKNTNMERYGVENVMMQDEIKEKRKNTNIEKYGYESPYSSPIIREKIKKTNIEKYGVENPMNLEEINQKRKNTNIEKYGYESPYSSPIIREKIKKTSIKKYGVSHPSQKHLTKETIKILNDKEKFSEFIKDKSAYEASKELGIVQSFFYTKTRRYGVSDLYKRNGPSYLEKEMTQFLDELRIKYEINNRKILNGLELDFYIPSHNLAIEMNGIYWHSDKFISDKNYHYNKWKSCYDVGVNLISIFEDDWINQTEKVKDIIKYYIRINDNVNSAENFYIETIDEKLAEDFLDNNHLQGFVSGNHYGVFNEYNTLIAIMTFSHVEGNTFELNRYATKVYDSDIFSKLFKYARNDLNFEKVIALTDNTFFKGNLLNENKFELIRIHGPEHKYFYRGNRINEESVNNIINELIDNGMTEYQVMNILDIPKVYDCGKCEWEWKI